MAAKLARCVRRQRRSLRTDRQSLPHDPFLTPVEQPDPERVSVFVLLTHILAWFHRCQLIYIVIAWICMSAFWTPLIKTDYLQRCEEHRRSLERLQGSINFTEPCAMGCDGQADRFVSDSFFSFYSSFFSVGTPIAVVLNVLAWTMFPAIKHHYRHQIRWLLQVMFTSVIISSIFNQIASAFATRSLSMFFNLRFLSMHGIQWLGFGLCLISSFVCGVKHAIHYAKSNKGRLE